MKDEKFLGIVSIIGLIAVAGILYSIFSGLWGFNPTEINLFNLKLGISSLIIFIICGGIFESYNEFF